MSSGEVNEGWDQQTSCRDVLGNKENWRFTFARRLGLQNHMICEVKFCSFVRITVVLCPITTTGSHVWVRGDDQQEKQLFLCPQEVNAAVLASVLSELEGIFHWKRLFSFTGFGRRLIYQTALLVVSLSCCWSDRLKPVIAGARQMVRPDHLPSNFWKVSALFQKQFSRTTSRSG